MNFICQEDVNRERAGQCQAMCLSSPQNHVLNPKAKYDGYLEVGSLGSDEVISMVL